MRLVKKVLFILSISLTIISLTLFFFYRSFKYKWSDSEVENEVTELVTKIKIANELPQPFYELYENENPGSLTSSLNNQIIKGIGSGNFTKSPSLLAAMISELSRKDNDSTKISNKKAYGLAWYLEDEVTQKECLNWVLANYKFDLYIHGIEEVANFYYRKSAAQLTERELSDIIALMKKPSIVSVPDRSNEKLY